jgi:hypothetical protein
MYTARAVDVPHRRSEMVSRPFKHHDTQPRSLAILPVQDYLLVTNIDFGRVDLSIYPITQYKNHHQRRRKVLHINRVVSKRDTLIKTVHYVIRDSVYKGRGQLTSTHRPLSSTFSYFHPHESLSLLTTFRSELPLFSTAAIQHEAHYCLCCRSTLHQHRCCCSWLRYAP